jgi:plastocyanin
MKAAIWKNAAMCTILAVACATTVAACGSSDTKAPTPSPSTAAPAATTVQIAVKDDFFDPATVTIKQGTTIRWTRAGKVEHSVTSGKESDANKGQIFDTDLDDTGSTFEFTFNDAGTFDYFCKYHAGMAASVVVEIQGTGPTN